jgi:hypothetical protein
MASLAHAGCRQQAGQLFLHKQAHFDGVLRNTRDLSQLFHGFLVPVDEDR